MHRRRYRRDEYEPRYEQGYRRAHRPQRRGCLGRIQDFFISVITTLLIGASILAFVGLIIAIAFNYSRFLALLSLILAIGSKIVFYGLFVLAGLIVLLIIYGLVRLIVAISDTISRGRIEKAKADLARNKVRSTSVQVSREKIKLAQEKPAVEPYAKYRRKDMEEEQLPRRTQKLTVDLPERQDLVRLLPPDDPIIETVAIPGMPNRIFPYAKYSNQLRPGQLIIGGKQDKSIRIGSWQDYKVLLVLGGSASGKTTTIIEKCLGTVRSGGLLIVCDPHGHKQDSLLRRLYPLKAAIFPGSTLAIEHADILRNIELAKSELDKRVHGADCSTSVTLVIEELNRLQRDKSISKAVTEILQIIGQEGRGYNVYAIVGAQQISYLAEIRKSIISFIVHRVDRAEAELCIPPRYAKYAPELKVGQSFVKDADGLTEPLMQILVDIQDIQAEAARIVPPQKQSSRQFYKAITLPMKQNGKIEEDLPDLPTLSVPAISFGAPRKLHRTTLTSEPLKKQLVPEIQPLPQLRQTDGLHQSRVAATWGESIPDTEDLQKPTPPSLHLADIVKQSQANLAEEKLAKLAKKKATNRI